MRRVEIDIVDPGNGGPRYARIPELEEAGVRHGFSCREPGSPRPAAETDVQRLAEAIGVAALPRARLRQVHSAQVHLALAATGAAPPGDALVATGGGMALAILTADCVPLLVFAPTVGGLAAVHAGWRGTLAGVLEAGISRLLRETGADPSSLLVVAGPAIRACCYEVGQEVEAAFVAQDPEASGWFHHPAAGRPRLDLIAANEAQAARLGVPAARFLDASACTRCRNDLFYSYRAEGAGTGRIVTLAAVA
jgi:YfiH family protein